MQTTIKNNTESIARFYNGLGIDGLSELLDNESNNDYLNYVTSNLVAGNILDAGCGYGRIAATLYEIGYEIEGVDIMPDFIDHINTKTSSNKFIVGDLRNLPYKNQSFDNIICMWSTFSHFLEQKDQIRVLQELYRLVKIGGRVIIDIPTPEIYSSPRLTAVKTEQTINHICHYTVNGNENTDYVHDDDTLASLLKLTHINSYSIERVMIGKLPRLILTLFKFQNAIKTRSEQMLPNKSKVINVDHSFSLNESANNIKNLVIEGTYLTPFVSFNKNTNQLEMGGDSIQLNLVKAHELFTSIQNWLTKYREYLAHIISEKPEVDFRISIRFSFKYVDTVSQKYLYNIFQQFRLIEKQINTPLSIEWHYDNTQILELGQQYDELTSADFHFTEKQVNT